MSYTHTGHMSKYLSAPKPDMSDPRLMALQDEIDTLHEQYNRLRCSDNRTWMPGVRSDECRKAGAELARIELKYRNLFDELNPDYVKHWRSDV